MLQIFRKYGSSITVKALMLLLVFTFAVWGVGDVIRGHNKYVALKVGDIEFSDREWFAYFNNQIERLKAQFNSKFAKDEIKNLGLTNVILGQLIDRLLLQQEATSTGVLVSYDMVKYELLHMPIFQVDGKFDKEKFMQVLQAMRVSEQNLFENIKENLPTQYETFALTVNKTPPSDLVDAILQARAAIRQVNVYRLPYETIRITDSPTEDELKTLYQHNSKDFMIPEKRNISYIIFGIEDIKLDEGVNEADLKQYYEQNKERFKELEKRSVLKLEFKDKARAEEAKSELDKGESFENVGRRYFPTVKNFSIGEVTRVGFEKEVANAIFNLKLEQYSNIIKTPLGYLIFKVTAITPEGVKSFDLIKDKVKSLYINELKYEKLNKISQDIDQMLALGKKVEDVALQYGFKIKSLEGVDDRFVGQPFNDEEFKQVAFSTAENNTSMVSTMKSQDKFFILQINKVVPVSKRDFKVVKGELEKQWYSIKKEEKVKVVAHELSESLKSKGDGDEILKKYNLMKPQHYKISYYNMDNDQPKVFLGEALKLRSNEITEPYKSTTGYLIAHVISIKPIEITGMQEQRQEIIANYASNAPNEVIAQYLNALKSKYNIEVNQAVIDKVIE